MVNEMANCVFTLPFNLRDPEEIKGVVKSRFISRLLIMPIVGAYPDPDLQVTRLLTEKFSSDPPPSPEYYLEAQSQELATLYHLFFKYLFETVRETIDASKMTEIIVPREWQRHLSDEVINQGKTMNNRNVLYQDVVNRVKEDNMLKKARARVRSSPFWE